MTTTIDVILEREHPQWDAIQSHVARRGGSLIPCEGSLWQTAMNAGHADWSVLMDHRAAMTIDDLELLRSLLESQQPANQQAPVGVHPTSASFAAERSFFEICPPNVALCWDNHARYSLVSVQRSALPELAAITVGHPEPIWDWLVKISENSQKIRFASIQAAEAPYFRPLDTIPGLITGKPTPEIGWLIQHIERTKPSQFVADCPQASIADSVAVKAGLLLWHDAADASHQLSQSIEGLGKQQAGDYWHAILHRREPDYSNAKYWFRQFQTHPVMVQLLPYVTQALHDADGGSVWETRLLGKGTWDPFAFVDFCEAYADQEDSPLGTAARRIQAAEMQLLMAATYRDASGMTA